VEPVEPRSHEGRLTVDCTGTRTFTEHLSYGVTWVAPPDALADGELRIHHMAPYKVVAAGVTGGTARLGSSSAKGLALATTQAKKMLATAVELGWTADEAGWEPVTGIRSSAAPDPYVQRTGQTSWRFGGFHRIGYAVAPVQAEALAHELMEALA
jgi:hypothetical protein